MIWYNFEDIFVLLDLGHSNKIQLPYSLWRFGSKEQGQQIPTSTPVPIKYLQ